MCDGLLIMAIANNIEIDDNIISIFISCFLQNSLATSGRQANDKSSDANGRDKATVSKTPKNNALKKRLFLKVYPQTS
jgi:hypothetical protein